MKLRFFSHAQPGLRRPGARTSARLAGFVALVLGLSLLPPTARASAEPVDVAADRELAVELMETGGPSVKRAAEAALLGSEQDLRQFAESGRVTAERADARAAAQVLAGMDGPSMRAAALTAMEGSPAAVLEFVNGGWEAAWNTDERVRVYRLLAGEVGPATKAAAEKALNGTAEDVKRFLSKERDAAAHADDRLAATRMLTGGPNNSGPVLHAAADQALKASAEDLREFLQSGQFVARARDAELASIQSLMEQAKAAGERTSRESLAAHEASARAANAAEEAKKAAQRAAQEASAAGGSARKASAAAGRAADAAAGAAAAAREAINASHAAMRAAQTAADAARRATTAAALTAQAAARAQRAAAAAHAGAGDAKAARQAAEAARDAAAKAHELQKVRAERDRAIAQATAAAKAAKGASRNADFAADAADQAGQQSGVSAQQAKRARDAAASARRAARVADGAADRAESLAAAAAKASQEAFAYAEQAAKHADNAVKSANAAAAAADKAQRSAQEAAKAAAAAVEAANVAVAAANQAVELEKLAREEDKQRLAKATEQGVLAAQEALEKENAAKAAAGHLAAWNRTLQWDTAEEDRVDASTRKLLEEASAPGASADVVLDKGRRAAVALMTTGGDWTKTAAAEALAGGEVELRSWLATGRKVAVGQDDRARVWHLIDTLPDGPEKTAAKATLDGNDAAVESFLRGRNYPGKVVKDRRAIYAIIDAAKKAGHNTVRLAAEKALAGTDADMHRFLRTGQYTARAADERQEVYRTMDVGGPEVDAAAEVALAGPPSYVSYFLAASRHQAAQRDVEQAAHVHTVRKLIVEAQQYAQTALADAAKANEAALDAAGKNAEADKAAAQAAQSAKEAIEHRDNARKSAAQAKASADQAAQSAQTARTAANRAQASADKAAHSAATATAAAQRARDDANVAYGAAAQARADALAAGKDAAAADLAAKEAAKIYTQKLKEFQERQRSTAPGSGPNGNGTALDDHKTWGCLIPEHMSKQCVGVYKDFASALGNPAKCAAPANAGTPGCTMLNDMKEFVEQNPDLLLDMLQFVLAACGLVPVAGEACDGADAAVSFSRGDWVGGFLSLGAMVPVAGWLATGGKAWKNSDKLRDITNMVTSLFRRCKRGSSFVAGTTAGPRDQGADGATLEIEEVTRRSETTRAYNISVRGLETYYAPPEACRITSSPTSPEFESQTVWRTNDSSIRVDVENPSPGKEGAAQFHVQFKGRGADDTKYYYNPSNGTWVSEDGVVLSRKKAKQIPQSAINKAKQYLGLTP